MSVKQGNKILSGKLKTNVGGLSANITDCILSIESKLNFVLSGNILTLKAGSKVYTPDGTETTLNTDKQINWSGTENTPQLVFINPSNLALSTVNEAKCSSGSTDSLAGTTYHAWFDTENKVVKIYTSNTTTPAVSAASFPLARIYFNSNGVDRADKVFNGFGYMGQHVFVIPGVTASIPNGRNEDGTLKNIILKTSAVKYGANTSSDRSDIWLDSSGNINRIPPNSYVYDETTNLRKTNPGGALRTQILVGQITGNITTCEFFTPFHAAEYKDLKKLEDDAVHKTGAETIPGNKSFTGNVSLGSFATATTPAYSDNDTSVATTAMVHNLNDAQRTNCITEIAQDIKLELNSGVLKLLSGSKAYIPNGIGVFNTLTTTADRTVSQSINGKHCVYINSNQELWCKLLSGFSSGSTAPAGVNDGIWYDTVNNKIEWWTGSEWTTNGGRSFPIAIVTVSGGQITSIDQVFNGFGYIGSTVFALPGVKGLYPNGRNADGTLRSGEINITNVAAYTITNTTFKTIRINSLGLSAYRGYIVSDTNPSINYNMWYNPAENIMYDTHTGTVSKLDASVAASIVYNGTRITSFIPKTAFHAVDYNDFEEKTKNLLSKTGGSMTAYLSNVLSTPQVRNISIGTSQPSNPINGDVFLLI